MSNKPKIKARCAAGCEWETVHKEDFLAACNLVKVNPNANGVWGLELGKQYKIKASNLENISITFKYNDNGTQATYNFEVPTNDKYANHVVFKLLEASVDTTTLTIVYEIAGVRYTETISGTSITLLTENYLIIENADSVYEYNEDNELRISVEGGEAGASLKSISFTTASEYKTFITENIDKILYLKVTNTSETPTLSTTQIMLNVDGSVTSETKTTYLTTYLGSGAASYFYKTYGSEQFASISNISLIFRSSSIDIYPCTTTMNGNAVVFKNVPSTAITSAVTSGKCVITIYYLG